MCTYLSLSLSRRLLRQLNWLFLPVYLHVKQKNMGFSQFVCVCVCVRARVGVVFVCRPAEEPTTWGGYLGKVLMASTTYLPSQVTEMFTQGRAFATVRLPFCGHKNICALAV